LLPLWKPKIKEAENTADPKAEEEIAYEEITYIKKKIYRQKS